MFVVRRFAVALLILAVALCLLLPASALACPFCGAQGQTLLGEVKQANLILFGTLTNARMDPTEFNKGSTDLNIEVVIKDHEILAGRDKITIPRYVPSDPEKQKFLIFCEVYDGKLDPYRGVPVDPKSRIAEYLQGAIAVQDKSVSERLAYFFQYLNDNDPDVANDALTEFGNSDYKDYRPLAETVDPAILAAWLESGPAASRLGLYGSMLGHCGTPEHAELLRRLLDEARAKRRFTGVDGVLAGYIMLKPEEGWEYLRGILSNEPKAEFLLRFAALRTVRFFWEFEPPIRDGSEITQEQMIDAVCLLLEQSDIADLPIDDLRKWGQWQTADRVFDLFERPSHQIPIVKRSIIKYALSCPSDNERAAALVEQARADDPERVRDIEELLRLEREARARAQKQASGGQ